MVRTRANVADPRESSLGGCLYPPQQIGNTDSLAKGANRYRMEAIMKSNPLPMEHKRETKSNVPDRTFGGNGKVGAQMRVLKICAVVALVLAVSGVARAGTTSIPIMWDIIDWSMAKTYTVPAGPPTNGVGAVNGLAQIPNPVPGAMVVNKPHTHSGNALIGQFEDSWSVVKIVNILTDPGGDILWAQATDPVNEMVGLVYGGVDNYVGLNALGEQQVVTEGIFYDVYVQPIGTFDDRLGSIGRLSFSQYVGVGIDYNDFGIDGLPATLDPGEGNGIYDAGEPTFPVGTLAVAAESCGGKLLAGAVGPIHRIATFQPQPFPVGSGDGTGFEFIDLIGGTWAAPGVGYADEGDPFYFGLVDPRFGSSQHADLHANQTVVPFFDPGNPADWIITSADPVRTAIVPEPMTVIGAFMALSTLGAYIRKRRTA